MNRYLLTQLFVVLMCLGLSSNASAQSAVIRIGSGYGECQRGPGFYSLQISFRAVGPAATARFKIAASSPVYFFSPTEFDVSIIPCAQGDYVLGYLDVLVPNGQLTTFSIVPLSGHSEIELIDCDGYALPTGLECYEFQDLAPYRPDPPTGTTNVPTNQLL